MVSITRTTCRVWLINNLKRGLELLLYILSVQGDEKQFSFGLVCFSKNESIDTVLFRSSYGKPVDIWACGCTRLIFVCFEKMSMCSRLGIMAELTTGQALFGTRNSISTIFFRNRVSFQLAHRISINSIEFKNVSDPYQLNISKQ